MDHWGHRESEGLTRGEARDQFFMTRGGEVEAEEAGELPEGVEGWVGAALSGRPLRGSL